VPNWISPVAVGTNRDLPNLCELSQREKPDHRVCSMDGAVKHLWPLRNVLDGRVRFESPPEFFHAADL